MNRRLGLAVLAGAICSPAFAQDNHAGHEHAAHAGGAIPHQRIIASAADCVRTGELCLTHCLEVLATGDTSLAGCARSVDQLVAVCAALQKLAASASPHLPALARVAIPICEDCERECRRHAEHHATCRDCAEACQACAEECRKLA
ncbi:Four-helix bundle copper-binding protein [Rhodovastum atsumiense]|uniref:Four-helix bundle copper-binding protein n=1 Tax=Rhodovastum atsumiense TaxID=504468 RepID=A0A5M6IQ27_9PROT|nr:four-helix bundle copper-binding protein [Rhodovastum atsumiense]KAA5610019.1 four-helix bundle copper-binding protein [Rhodovastum atsumiense]CAH2602996.1 Four-helix bundle copper-binding protein [Rhodovastum atsumiense]